jgi:deoxyribose-phosphate aldolase
LLITIPYRVRLSVSERVNQMDIEAIVAKVTQEVLARVGNAESCNVQKKDSGADIANTIEHSVLNPDITSDKIVAACREARNCRMANVCVSPYYVSLACEQLRGSGVKVSTAVGFPHGAASTVAKVAEAREAVKNGAEELDVAMNILAIKNGEIDEAVRDLKEVVNVAKGKAIVKAIYEQSVYSDKEKPIALNVAKTAGADFVKISNALSGKKACVEDVKFVRGILGSGMGIKIDGGISDAATIRELMAAGAQRFGCSKSVQIIKGE